MTEMKTYSRWATWEKEVLARVHDPAKCQEVIRARQEAVDDDASEAELVAEEFREELRRHRLHPPTACVFLPSRVAADLLKRATGTHRATNKASGYLASLNIRELFKTKKDEKPGWKWLGLQAPANAVMARLGDAARTGKNTTAMAGDPSPKPVSAELAENDQAGDTSEVPRQVREDSSVEKA